MERSERQPKVRRRGHQPTWATQFCSVFTISGKTLAFFALLTLFARSGFCIDWAKRDEEFTKEILPLLNKACLDCHSGAEADGGLALSHFKSAKAVLKERKTWEKVITRVQLGDMPPKDAPPFPEADRKKFIAWLNSAINDVECGKTPNPGSITVRRLNKFEYRNTIRDLFGLDYEPAADFPGDDVGYGFDNIGDVLTLPPLLMEKYLTAAEQISRKVILAPAPGPILKTRIVHNSSNPIRAVNRMRTRFCCTPMAGSNGKSKPLGPGRFTSKC